jgi:hypothetical protein
MVSANAAEAGERVLALGVDDGKAAGKAYLKLRSTLARVRISSGNLALKDDLGDGASLAELRQLRTELGRSENMHRSGHQGRYFRKDAALLRQQVEAAIARLERTGEQSISLKEVAFGREGRQTDNRAEQVAAAFERVGAPADLIERLRGTASRDDVVAAERYLTDLLKRPRSELALRGKELAQTARGLLQLMRQGSKRMDREKVERLPFDALVDPAAPAAVRQSAATADAETVSWQARAMRSHPDYFQPLETKVANTISLLRSKVQNALADGKDASVHEHALEYFEAVRIKLSDGDYEAAAELLQAASIELQRAVQKNPSDGQAALETRALAAELTQQAQALPRVRSVSPPALKRQSEQYFAASVKQSQIILDAVFADPATLLDDIEGSGRRDPHDVATAMLRYNVAAWTVMRDIRAGTVDPQAAPPNGFGKSWEEVSGADVRALAMARFESGDVDYGKEAQGMLRDPVWQQHPIMMPTDEGRKELRPENVNSWFGRSLGSLLAPQSSAMRFVHGRMMQIALGGAGKVGDASTGDARVAMDRASVNTVHALFLGPEGHDRQAWMRRAAMASPLTSPLASTLRSSNLPPSASQVQATLVEVAGIDIVDAKHSKVFATKAEAAAALEQKNADKSPVYAGMVTRPDGSTLCFKLKGTEQIAKEVVAKIEAGELDHLGQATLTQIRELLAGDPPGKVLAKRMKSEADSRFWRVFGSEVVKIAAVGAVSGGVGVAAGAGLTALRVGTTAVRIGQLMANSASFTTLMGLSSGDFSAERYATDLLMFGALSKLGKLAQSFKYLKSVKGDSLALNTARFVTRQGITIGSTSALVHGMQSLEAAAKGQELPGWREFGHTLAMVSILHTVSANLSKLTADPTVRLQARAQLRAADAEMQALIKAMEAGDIEAASKVLARLNTQREQVQRLVGELHESATKRGSHASGELYRTLALADARYGQVVHVQQTASQIQAKWAGKPAASRTTAEQAEHARDIARYRQALDELPADIRVQLGGGDPFGVVGTAPEVISRVQSARHGQPPTAAEGEEAPRVGKQPRKRPLPSGPADRRGKVPPAKTPERRSRPAGRKDKPERPPRRREGLTPIPKRADPTARPGGRRTQIPDAADRATRRALGLENQAANDLAKAGFNVEQNPATPGRHNPDLRVNGNIFDVYSPEYGTSAKSIFNAIGDKIRSGQTQRIVLNLDECKVGTPRVRRELSQRRGELPDLREVFVLRKGKVTRVYP